VSQANDKVSMNDRAVAHGKRAAKTAADLDPEARRIFNVMKRAQDGDESTRAEVRRWLADTGALAPGRGFGLTPLAGRARDALVGVMSGRDKGRPNVLLEEDARFQVGALGRHLAGEHPTPLERLLAERAALCWLSLYYFETIHAQNLPTLSLDAQEFHLRRIEGAHRRLLSAVKALAQVRRLQLPAVQINVGGQVNVGERQVNMGQVNVAGVTAPKTDVPKPQADK